jgi:hypothetical protein
LLELGRLARAVAMTPAAAHRLALVRSGEAGRKQRAQAHPVSSTPLPEARASATDG